MTAPHQPSDTVATAEVTSGSVLSPPVGDTADGPQDPPALPDRDAASADAVVDDIDRDDTDQDDTDQDDTDQDDTDQDDTDQEDSEEDGAASRPGAGPGRSDLLVREGDVAGDYLERLLDILDVDGDIDLDVEGDRASVAIVGGELSDLVGRDGAVLDALQELTRLAVAQATGVRSRLMLDIGGFRARRRSDLSALAAEAGRRVAESRQPERLSPMNPFERKVVHDVVAGLDGVHSESEGEEPRRRVVILPGA